MKKRMWILFLTALLALCCAAASAATVTTEGTVTLKLNGSTEAALQVLSNEQMTLSIEAPGATAVRLRKDNGDEVWTEEIWKGQDWNTVFIEQERSYQEETFDLWLQARYDDFPGDTDLWREEEESLWEAGTESNRITVTVTSRGTIPVPSAAWVGGNSASGLDWLKVEITQPLNMGEWYWADVGHPLTGGDVDWFDNLQFAEDNTLTFPAERFGPGYYAMDVFAGAYGLQNRSTRLYFTVTVPEQPVPETLALSKHTVSAGESLEIVGYVPDAEELWFAFQKTQDPAWTDNQYRDGPLGMLEQHSFSDPGEYSVTLYAREEGNDDFRKVGADLLTVEPAEDGRLSRPDFSALPALVGPGQGLAGTIGLDERATYCGIRLEYCPEDQDWEEIFRTDRRVENGQTSLNLPASLFTRTGRYKLNVWANGPFLEGNGADYWFLRKDETPGAAVTLTVNGKTEDIASWPSSSDLEIRAQAPGATALRLLQQDEWRYEDCRDGSVEWRTGFGDGDYVLAVQMTTADPVWREENFDWGSFRWEELEWGAVSNTVRVHVESRNGAKTEPEVTLSAESLHRGEILTVTVEPQAENEWYWLDILRLEEEDEENRFHWDNLGHRDFGSSPELRLSTLGLEPGEYWLQIGIDAEGWDGQQTIRPITVLEPEGELPEAELVFSRETMLANQGVNVTAYAPGCRHFVLEIRWDRDPDWRDGRDDWGEDEYTWGWGCGSGGEYTFTLYYWLPGDEEPRTLSRTFTVITHGSLAQPEILGVPDFLDLGTGISGSFTAVEGAESYHVGIRYSEDDQDWEDLFDENRNPSDPDATKLVFGSEMFSRPGQYQLWVSADTVGLDNGYQEKRILVMDPGSFSDALVMRVKGETDGSRVEAYLHQNLPVTVDAPENVTAVRVRNSTSEWEYRFYLDESYEFELGVHEGGANTFLVQASTDTAIVDWWNEHHSLMEFDWNRLDWNMTGNRVTVNVIKYGDLDDPEMEFPNGTAVERGEMLAYRISPVENAWGYGIQVRRLRANGSTEDRLLVDMQLEDLKGPLLTALPTDGLEPGNYRLYVDPRQYGWHGDQKGYDFTVTESAGWQDEPVFRASKMEYLTQEPMIFSAWAPGAAEMHLCYASPDNVWFEAWGDTLVDRVVPNWERVYRVMAYAYYPGEENYEDGNWVQIGETLEIRVTAPYGAMGASLEAPARVRTDEAWTMELTCDFKGTDGYAECYLEDGEGNLMDYHFLEEREENGALTAVWQVDADTLEPGIYYITGYVFPGKMGYALGAAEALVTVSDGELNATLTVSKNEAEVFEDVEVTVNAPGATAVGIYDGWAWTCDLGETLTDAWPMWDEGSHVFYGRYTTEEVNPDAPGFDWENVHWDGFTNAETVLVNPAVGTLEEPVFTVADHEVERGEEFLVTVTSRYEGVENVAFGAHLVPLGEEFSDLPWFGADENGIIRVKTVGVAPGEYWLMVSANAISWHGSSDRIQVTVTAPEALLEFDKETMQAGEGMNVTAFVPGCRHFVLDIRWDRNPDWRDGRDDWGEDEYTWGWGCGSGGEYTFTLYYWLPGDEEPRTLSRTFTVITHGSLAQPEILNVPDFLDLGTGISGSFTAVEGAESYHVGIRYSEDDQDWEDLFDENRNPSDPDATELVFGSEVFSRPGMYVLWVSANTEGLDNGYREKRILVMDPGSFSDALVMRVKGETDGSRVEAYLHQELQVTVEAPENVTAVRVRNSTSEWEYRFYLDETYEWRLGVHEGGANTFLVQASTDMAIVDWWNEHHSLMDFDWNRLDWNMTGNRVTVDVIKFGDLNDPEMEFPNGTTVERGVMLAYRISPVEHAWGYGIQVRRLRANGSAEDRLLVDMQLEDLKGPLLTALPTDGLEPGHYRLYVDPRQYGWHGDQKGYDFTVTESAGWQDEPVFRASKMEYLTQEPMIFSAWAPGAAEMHLCYASPDNVWFEAWGDTLVDRVVPNWERVYRVMAYAYYPGEENYEDGNWVQIGDTLEINVTAPYGAMGAELEAPATVRTDETWTMELTCDFRGTDGYAECYLMDAEDNQMDYHFLETREAAGGYTAVWQVDAGALEPGLYYITGYVFPGAQGYALGVAEAAVTVSDGTLNGTLTVDRDEVELFEDVEITVEAPGATAVGIYDGQGWTCGMGDTLTEAWTMWDEGSHVFYGGYITEEVDPEAPGFDWQNVNWEGFTNAETVWVNTPVGTLEEPAFTVAENEVKRGEEFLVTVTSRYEGVEDVAFGAHLIPLGEEFSDLPWFGADENGIIRVDTLETEPGEYWLMVSANAVSWYGSANRIQVTVTEPEAGARIFVDEDSLTTGAVFQIKALAPGAEHLTVAFAYSEGGWESDPLEADGDYLIDEGFTGETACTMELILTAEYPDHSTETVRKTITVTAPKGDLHPVILLPGPWTAGSDLRFTVNVPEGAQYVVWVWDGDASEDDEAIFATFMREHPTYTYELDSTEYGFQEGKLYRIVVIAAGTGFNQGEAEVLLAPVSAASTVLRLPAGLTELEAEALAGTAAEKIIVPQGVTRIGDRAFADCPNLKELELPEGITFGGEPLKDSGPVFVYGPVGSWLEAYAEEVEGLYFIPVN